MALANTALALRRACETVSTRAEPIFELALTPAFVAIALIERFAAGGSHFEEEPGECGVEIIDAASTGRANATPDQR